MWRNQDRYLSLLVGSAFAYYLLFNFSADVWWAGWGFGPRLLVPVLAWAMIPVAYSLSRVTSWGGIGVTRGFVIWGLFYYQLTHLVFPEMPENAVNPVMDLVVPALANGHLSPNLLTRVFGVTGSWSIVPALFLVAVAAYWILRADVPLNMEWSKRIRALLVSCAVLLPMILTICLIGPRWSKKETRHFLKWMDRMSKIEIDSLAESDKENR
jgi:hypothetical protein